MKNKLLLIAAMICISTSIFAQANIGAARAMAVGSTVTITGIVTNGSELGAIRYVQDPTGGIAAYSTTMSGVSRGDSVTLTGVLKLYNQLLEIDPVSSFTIKSSGNTLPTPEIITPSGLSETTESELVRINNATFANGGATFSSNTSYTFTSGAQTATVFVRSGSPLIGQIVPSGSVNLIGICSQFGVVYQLLMRDINDIISNTSISITSPLQVSNITSTGFDISWTTNINGSSEIWYGNTTALELGTLTGTGNTVNHTVSITAADPSEIFYVKAFSVNNIDTAKSAVKTFVTASASTGNIKIYFNHAIDNTVSTGTNAIAIPNLLDDTLIQYINRAKYTIDIAMYNFGINSIATAINNAYARGVVIRYIYETDNANTAVNTMVSGIKRLADPTGTEYGIMHNKFVIIDAFSANPNDAILWTGSTNMTDANANDDDNNVIIFQDQSIAKAYVVEFEEMWGNSTAIPGTNGKFGPYKTDNTPHEFIIGGKRVESYFSPSDGTNDQIIKSINSANDQLCIETMLITRTDIAYAIQDKINANVATYILVNSFGECSTTVTDILSAALGNKFIEDAAVQYIMHNKTLIVDQNNTASDPLVLTGSHNWSNAGNNTNDENTVIVHDATIANLYYQEFVQRFKQNGGTIGIDQLGNNTTNIMAFPNPSNGNFNVVLNLNKKETVTIQLYDINGKVVYTSQQEVNQGKEVININKESLSKGIYCIKVNSEKATLSGKMIVQ